MKQVQNLTIIAIAAFLTACGGGGGGGGDNNGNTGNGGNTNPGTEQPKPPVVQYPSEIQKPDYASEDATQVYDILNQATGHTQSAQYPGFTGADLGARIANAGYAYARVGENVTANNSGTLVAGTSPSGIEKSPYAPTGKAMINRLFSTVYHLGLSVQEWNEVGVGVNVSTNLTTMPNETVFYGATVVNFGTPAGTDAPVYSGNEVRSFPCQGISAVSPIFTAESPSPYPTRDFDTAPMGTPVVVVSPKGEAINVTSATITSVSDNTAVVVKILNSTDDVNKLVKSDQAFIIPDVPLKSSTQYQVNINGTYAGNAFVKAFSFKTGTQN